MYKFILKRFIDILISASGLVLLTPILILIALILIIFQGRQPFFFQQRPGKNHKIFKIIKFKTMSDKKDSEGNLLSDKYRITKIGKILRKFSLDEIPQLWNVFKGDMSIVGPRPLLVKYLPLYTPYQLRRHNLRPGITGWSQINGRNNIQWAQKLENDVWYVENLSFSLDIKILFLTFKKVVMSEGISTKGEATSSTFQGGL
jgi:lipopolysaccharide/colanic/teichoic acid biosynthesis glycosyltransferase